MKHRRVLAGMLTMMVAPQAPVFAQQSEDPATQATATATASDLAPATPKDTGASEPPVDVIPVANGDAEAAPTQSSERPKSRLVEEIVVTARKREENLQDVPFSIVAFSSDKLEAAGVETAEQLDKITPGLVFNRVIGFNTVFLRGVGSDAYLPSADPSVPIYVDDISSLPSQGSIDSVVNVERIEVLKGPQGTLFGRNALGGAIRIVTPDPDDSKFSSQLKADLGRYNVNGADTYSVSGFANIPFMEGLAATLSGIYRREDPFYKNDLGYEVSREQLRAARLKVKWAATDSLDFILGGSLEDAFTSGGLAGEGTDPSAVLCAICVADPKFDYHTSNNVPALLRTKRSLFSGQMNWNLGFVNAKLLLSDQELRVPSGWGDLDYTSSPLLTGNVGKQYAKQKTAELRFESTQDTPLSDVLTWVVGTYYLRSEGGYDPLLIRIGGGVLDMLPSVRDLLVSRVPAITEFINTADLPLATSGILKTDSLSAFAEGTYNIIDPLDLTVGLRYDTETRKLVNSRVDVLIPTTTIPVNLFNFEVPDATTERVSPRAMLKWSFDHSQVYGSYSIGYLSPTYNTVNIFKAPDFVKQEKDTAYELGFKGTYFDGYVQLEGAIFHIQRENVITAFTALTSGGAVSFFNAGDGESNGAELSIQAEPLPELLPGFSLIAAGSYLDAKYTSATQGRGYDDGSGLAFGPDSLFGLPARDFSGNRIVNTPKWSGSTTVAQMIPLPKDWGEIEIAADAYFNSGYFFTAQNTYKMKQDAYQTYGARITYFYTPAGLELVAYASNLTDERYFASAVQIDFGPGRSLAAPRQVGMRVKWSFE